MHNIKTCTLHYYFVLFRYSTRVIIHVVRAASKTIYINRTSVDNMCNNFLGLFKVPLYAFRAKICRTPVFENLKKGDRRNIYGVETCLEYIFIRRMRCEKKKKNVIQLVEYFTFRWKITSNKFVFFWLAPYLTSE